MPGRILGGGYALYVPSADGTSTVYLPGDEVPADVAKVHANPKLWGDGPELEGGADGRPAGNASTEAWAEYAKGQGRDVEGLSRDEIRALFV